MNDFIIEIIDLDNNQIDFENSLDDTTILQIEHFNESPLLVIA